MGERPWGGGRRGEGPRELHRVAPVGRERHRPAPVGRGRRKPGAPTRGKGSSGAPPSSHCPRCRKSTNTGSTGVPTSFRPATSACTAAARGLPGSRARGRWRVQPQGSTHAPPGQAGRVSLGRWHAHMAGHTHTKARTQPPPLRRRAAPARCHGGGSLGMGAGLHVQRGCRACPRGHGRPQCRHAVVPWTPATLRTSRTPVTRWCWWLVVLGAWGLRSGEGGLGSGARHIHTAR